jgi:hypothetical protein
MKLVSGVTAATAGQLRDTGDHLFDESIARRWIEIAGRRQADTQHHEAAGIEPAVDGLQLCEAPRHQRRADEQHDRQRHFPDDERVAQSPRRHRTGRRS